MYIWLSKPQQPVQVTRSSDHCFGTTFWQVYDSKVLSIQRSLLFYAFFSQNMLAIFLLSLEPLDNRIIKGPLRYWGWRSPQLCTSVFLFSHPWLMDFDELDELDPVEVPDEATREIAVVILGATGSGFGFEDWRRKWPKYMNTWCWNALDKIFATVLVKERGLGRFLGVLGLKGIFEKSSGSGRLHWRFDGWTFRCSSIYTTWKQAKEVGSSRAKPWQTEETWQIFFCRDEQRGMFTLFFSFLASEIVLMCW